MLKTVSSYVNFIGALNYKGTWNASTNSPPLASGVGTKGDYYVVSVAGNTNLDGETNWGVGDWAVFNGSVWQKVDGGSTGNLTTLTVTGNTYLATTSGDVGVGATSVTAIYGKTLQVGSGASEATTSLVGSTGSVFLATVGATAQLIARGGTALVLGTNDVERARIDTSGNVGIGTTSPGAKLQVDGASNGATLELLRLSNTGTGANTKARLNFYAASTNYASITGGYGASAPEMVFDINTSAGAYIWNNNSTEQMRIDTSGNVGIGTSSPGVKLDIRGSAVGGNFAAISVDNTAAGSGSPANTVSINFSNGGAVKDSITGAVYGDGYLTFATNDNTEKMRITASGNVGIGTSSPVTSLQVGSGSGVKQIYIAGAADLVLGASGGTVMGYGSGAISLAFNNTSIPLGIATLQSQPLLFGTNATERMRIDTSGNVGIGTSAPVANLDVRGASGGILGQFLENDSGNSRRIRFSISGNVSSIESTASAGTTNLALVVDGSERMRITSAGDVGIGTSSPAVKLQVSGGNIRLDNNQGLEFGGSNNFIYGNETSDFVVIATNAAERMRITSTGDVGIGTSSPAVKLDVSGTINAGSSLLIGSTYGVLYGDTGNSLIIGADNGNTSASSRLQFNVDGTERMRITAAGDVGIGTSSPSGKLDVVGAVGAISINGNGNLLGFSTAGQNYIYASSAGGFFTFHVNSGAEAMRLDSAGNLGLGVTPSAWVANAKALQISSFVSLWQGSNGATQLGFGVYEGGINTYNYSTTGDYPTMYRQLTGAHSWFTAPSGTAGNTISFTQAMTLDRNGNLGLGVTPSVWGFGGNIEMAGGGFITTASHVARYGANFYYGASNPVYTTSNFATQYQQANGQHQWFTAPSGTAGNAITFTQAMTLDSSGRLLVGRTSSAGSAYSLELDNGASDNRLGMYAGGTLTGGLLCSTNEIRLLAIGASTVLTFQTNGSERARIPAAGGMVVGTAAVATTATDGFLYVPTCAGTPTGTPTTQTGTAPIVIDTTNNKLYFYSGGAWRDAGP